jgi:arsenite methyltransferase
LSRCNPGDRRVAPRLRGEHDECTSNHLTTTPPSRTPSADPWAEWLLHRRNGGDPEYERVVEHQVQRMRDRVLDGAGPLAGVVLIDIGTGDGLIVFGALERVGPSLKAVLVDPSNALLSRAEQRSVELGVRESCRFLQASAERLDGIGDESADVLTTRAVLVYVPDKVAAAREFCRVLKPGGRLSIAEPIYRDEAVHLAAFVNLLTSQPENNFPAPVQHLQRCRAAQIPSTLEDIQSSPLTSFSERELIALFQKSGFSEIHLELHIDVRKEAAMPWNTFIDTAPRPGAPTLREVFPSHLSGAEQLELEKGIRPMVEGGLMTTRSTIAYLTASKSRSRTTKSSQ